MGNAMMFYFGATIAGAGSIVGMAGTIMMVIALLSNE